MSRGFEKQPCDTRQNGSNATPAQGNPGPPYRITADPVLNCRVPTLLLIEYAGRITEITAHR